MPGVSKVMEQDLQKLLDEAFYGMEGSVCSRKLKASERNRKRGGWWDYCDAVVNAVLFLLLGGLVVGMLLFA